MTVDEVKNLLKIYYDIPTMIAEEFATIRNCEIEKNKVVLPPANLSGLPGGKEKTTDLTASMALANQVRYYDDEIKRCTRRIAELRDAKNWLGVALGKLDPTDRYILELRYMGNPKNRKQAHKRRPTWKEIAELVHYSKSQTRERAKVALLQLMQGADQMVFSE
jgi:hypothetical protein